MNAQQRRHQRWVYVGAVSNCDNRLHFVVGSACETDGFFENRECISTAFDKDLSRVCELNALLISLEDSEADSPFKLHDLLAQGGLCDFKTPGGTSEAEFFS
jgi:hypothetical protein